MLAVWQLSEAEVKAAVGTRGHDVRADAPTENEASARALSATTLRIAMLQPSVSRPRVDAVQAYNFKSKAITYLTPIPILPHGFDPCRLRHTRGSAEVSQRYMYMPTRARPFFPIGLPPQKREGREKGHLSSKLSQRSGGGSPSCLESILLRAECLEPRARCPHKQPIHPPLHTGSNAGGGLLSSFPTQFFAGGLHMRISLARFRTVKSPGLKSTGRQTLT